ncbi:hypothetical protein GALMADRAFT_230433 [Galerina marginata CBS 339.88]|uniref:F-box domain-containing protein n=1 Tax=Galerina marginata (strain CBS 339.88) TaxID=685588 RepID=A0A067SPW8_GALM3|nr:hypothetical protein GALMADRAFT_230433 [Galerina marginata CBS 339.88]
MLPYRVQAIWWNVANFWYLTEATIRRVTTSTTSNLSQKARKSKRKAKAMKRKAFQRSRHGLYSSFPGISKVKLPEPPVPHLLRSNIPPTEQETTLIREAISMAEAEELRLEEELHKQGHRQHDLTVYKLERASTFIREQKAVLSLIRKIPPEILQDIFIYTVSPTSGGHDYGWLYANDLPWGLSQVSNLWRTTALSMSVLWSRIPTINLGEEYTKRERYQEFLNEILRRSHTIPIEVHLYGPLFFSDDTHPAIDILLPHSSRWRKCKLEMQCASLVALEGIKGHLDSLQVLLIRSYDSRSFMDSDVVVSAFKDAPHLRSVRLSGTYASYFALPLLQLTDYTEEDCHINQMNDLIDPSLPSPIQNLAILDFRQFGFARSLITLPLLVVLKARFNFGIDHQSLLEFLILPTLEELSVSSNTGPLIPSVSSMISRTGRPSLLNKLFLRSQVPDEGGELMLLLDKTPLISHLNVSLPPTEDLLSLVPVKGGQVVAPGLQICEFFVDGPLLDDTISHLNLLASSRCEPSDRSSDQLPLPGELQRLRTIYLHFSVEYPGVCEPQQRKFQNWVATENALSLIELRKLLIQYIPELYFGRRRHTKKILDFKRKDEASHILACIENLDVAHAEEIYHSGIHRTLQRLSYWFMEKNSRYKLSQTSKRILRKWNPLFVDSLKDFHWAMKDGASLMYLSEANSLRSMENPTNFVFDVEDCAIPPSDLPWPLFGCI